MLYKHGNTNVFLRAYYLRIMAKCDIFDNKIVALGIFVSNFKITLFADNSRVRPSVEKSYY